jgi:hypothetical protein
VEFPDVHSLKERILLLNPSSSQALAVVDGLTQFRKHCTLFNCSRITVIRHSRPNRYCEALSNKVTNSKQNIGSRVAIRASDQTKWPLFVNWKKGDRLRGCMGCLHPFRHWSVAFRCSIHSSQFTMRLIGKSVSMAFGSLWIAVHRCFRPKSQTNRTGQKRRLSLSSPRKKDCAVPT